MKSVIVIGAGFAGLSTSCYLAKAGYEVTLLEKNSWIGGRAQVWESRGFRFDMGPSFYWMPEVFETFFKDFGYSVSEKLDLTRLDPSYSCVFSTSQTLDISSDLAQVKVLFDSIEEGAGNELTKFLETAKKKYNIALENFLYKQFSTLFDFISPELIKGLGYLDIHRTYSGLVRKHFKSPQIRAIMEYPTVFLGAPGTRIPGTYTLMNYVDFILGTWYPKGGFSRVAEAMGEVARGLGVIIHTNEEVESLYINSSEQNKISSVITNKNSYQADIVVSAAPYHYTESLLPSPLRTYTKKYWDSRVLSPSCLNFYMGISKKLPNLRHHTFFFDKDWEQHFEDTYGDNPKWQDEPLFYVHVPSITEPELAPKNSDCLYILVPVASGLEDSPQQRDRIRSNVLKRISEVVGFDVHKYIVTERSYAHNDFVTDYNALKGSAFGLGHTLFQTASFRPKNKSPKVRNLFFTGQDTIPGTSTVMSTISGKVTADRVKSI